jgi:Ca2+-binding EF-hand superfamily protein
MELWKSFKARVDDDDESEDEIRTAFRSYDIDGDGYITKDEMVTVKTADRNHN